jgi:hypothetical protein
MRKKSPALKTTPYPLETEAIYRLGRENPDILIQMIGENFLPPPQLAHAIDALGEACKDEKSPKMIETLVPLLEHYSSVIRKATLRALHIGGPFGGDVA